jgi:hypothetical protein
MPPAVARQPPLPPPAISPRARDLFNRFTVVPVRRGPTGVATEAAEREIVELLKREPGAGSAAVARGMRSKA